MRNIFSFLMLFLQVFIVTAAEGQVIKGIVMDEVSREPLPFVNIGVINRNMGTISRDNGQFEIRLENVSQDEELTFSMVGYQIQSIRIESIGNGSLQLYLQPKTYLLKEVTVTDSRIKNPVKLGRFKPSRTTTGHSGAGNFGFGGEWGIRIFNSDKTSWIQAVSFHLRFNTLDSVLFRINLYSITNDLPGESLLQQPLYVKSYKGDKWITRNLEAERLLIDEDIIVSYEVVRLWYSDRGENHLFFTHGEGYEQSKTYIRKSSQDQWQVQESPPITLFLTVESLEKD